jgi:hypothetical protein
VTSSRISASFFISSPRPEPALRVVSQADGTGARLHHPFG